MGAGATLPNVSTFNSGFDVHATGRDRRQAYRCSRRRGAPADGAGLFHAALLCPAGITFHLVAENSWQIPPPQRAQRCGRSPRASPARITPHVPPSPKNSAAFALGTLRPTRVDRITYRDEIGNPLAHPAPPSLIVQTATSAAQSPDAQSATHRRRAPRPH